MKRFDLQNQSIISTFSPGFGGTSIPEWIKPWLDNGLGSITLFGSNTPTLESTGQLIRELRSYNPDLVIAIDEEGGDVTRLFVREGSRYPTPALLGQCDDEELTYSSYHSMGTLLRELGVNLTYAPVADVVAVHNNPIVGVRSFGTTADLVSRHVVQAVAGLQDAGVGACLKHFPGHGAVVEDSHHSLPHITMSKSEYEAGHVSPFKNAIARGVSAVMVGHLVVDSLDNDNAASLSPKIQGEYLRRSLGFKGLIVTDALDMGALGGVPRIQESALQALLAGSNLLCFSGLGDQSQIVEASLLRIKDALIAGEITSDYLETLARLVRDFNTKNVTKVKKVGEINFDKLAAGMQVSGLVNLTSPDINLIEIGTRPTIAAGDVSWGIHRELRAAGVKFEIHASDSEGALKSDKQLVVAFRDAYRDTQLLATLQNLQKRKPDAIFIDMGWPTLEFTPHNLIRSYGSSAVLSRVVVSIINTQLRVDRFPQWGAS
jgi:beta-N-acetylhexosaminidase